MTTAIPDLPKTSHFTGRDGLRIAYRRWEALSPPRAVVVIVPGYNSHSGYYGWTADQLVAQNYSAYAVDLRGRGQSDGERFHLESFADYTDDVGGLVAVARRENEDVPIFLLGHSAGGVVACVYTLEHQDELAGLICASFAFEVPAPDFAVAALKGLSHLFPHAHVLRLPNKDFSRDPAAVARMDADPLIANETQSTKTVAELARADDRLKHSFEQFRLPLFILHGTADHATKPSGSQHFFDAAGSSDKTLRLYEGHYHDMLNDIDKEEVMADIISWLDRHVP